jgi:hypothetical protein
MFWATSRGICVPLETKYGGDCGKTVAVCAQRRAPVAAFPGRWARNDRVIYDGTRFPAPYRGGAFIAFHGSPDRAPDPQGGDNVVFQPLADVRPGSPSWSSRTTLPAPTRIRQSGVPPDRARRKPGRRALHRRRRAWPHLAHHLQWRRFRQGRRRAGARGRRDRARVGDAARGDASERWPKHACVAHTAWRHRRSGSARRPDISGEARDRTCSGCHESGRRRQHGRARAQFRPLAMERRQSVGAHRDDREGRGATQAVSGRRAAVGRRATFAARHGGGGGGRVVQTKVWSV